MKIKNIFFDFDGVIADSINVKSNAFYQIYEKYGQAIAQKVVEHHQNHGGMSRFKKFKFYHKIFLNIDLTETQINELASMFSKLVKQAVIEAPEISGARNFLKKYYRSLNFWIISGTPTDEIREIVQQKKMEKYFSMCYGSPPTKSYWVKELLKKHSLKKAETLFVGDAKSDYQAALDNKIQFILKETIAGESIFKDIDVPRFSKFSEFEIILKNSL